MRVKVTTELQQENERILEWNKGSSLRFVEETITFYIFRVKHKIFLKVKVEFCVCDMWMWMSELWGFEIEHDFFVCEIIKLFTSILPVSNIFSIPCWAITCAYCLFTILYRSSCRILLFSRLTHRTRRRWRERMFCMFFYDFNDSRHLNKKTREHFAIENWFIVQNFHNISFAFLHKTCLLSKITVDWEGERESNF